MLHFEPETKIFEMIESGAQLVVWVGSRQNRSPQLSNHVWHTYIRRNAIFHPEIPNGTFKQYTNLYTSMLSVCWVLVAFTYTTHTDILTAQS